MGSWPRPLLSRKLGGPSWEEVIRDQGERGRLYHFFQKEQNLCFSWNSSGSTINTMVAAILVEECLRYLAPAMGEVLTHQKQLQIDMTSMKISFSKAV